MRVYISGYMTNGGTEKTIPPHRIEAFEQAERFLTHNGHEVVNPLKLPHKHSKTWPEFMAEDMVAMETCEAAFFLFGWETSVGAELEYYFAKLKGITVFVQLNPSALIFEVE